MAKSNLYTRTGDQGKTSLAGGQRVKKNDIRLEAYGSVDEFSATLGILHARHDVPDDIKSQLLEIQNMMFNFGAYLATLPEPGSQPDVRGLDITNIEAIEKWIDALDEYTPKVNAFVLPGGSESAAFAHLARTVCRRAERNILRLAETSFVSPELIAYFNRLSDYLFILARYINNAAGIKEIIWTAPK